MTILAAIDDSSAARPVLDLARRLATLFAAHVESVHVQEDDSGQSAAAIADAAHIPLHVRHGDVASALRTEMHERGAIALVIGTRGIPAGATPAGHIALDLVQSLDWPVFVVPPHAADRPLRRVLVAVEGDGESHALRGLFERLEDRPTPEVIVFHVIEPSELPPFADSPVHEADAFEREFMIGASSTVVADSSRLRFEMRVGDAASVLCDAARELDVDLVVIAWHRNLAGGHGRLVHEMLASASVPVALLPLDVRLDGPPQPAEGCGRDPA
jgi:nucleotide-binding universal stress UspA family protein